MLCVFYNLKWLKDSTIRKRLLFRNLQRKSQKTILSSCQQGCESWVKATTRQQFHWKKKKKESTLCTLMEGNMFWNMEAMSLTCMPSDEKLLRMSSGWCVNCCSCIRCFFRVETTSLMREYCKKRKSLYKNWEKLKVINDFFSSGTSVRLLWKHH